MPRPDRQEHPSDDSFHLSTAEIEAWLEEGREMRVSLAERIAARKKRQAETGEKAA